MRRVENLLLDPDQAALWPLGQAGCLVRAGGVTAVIDPYLSDSVAAVAPDCTRLLPVPIEPDILRADVFLVTHDHLDHLDPGTIGPYRFKATTQFVAPRLACRKLAGLGVPAANLHRVDVGETAVVRGVTVRGGVAVPTEPAVADTAGYHLVFPNGRSLYHSADTGFSEDLIRSAAFAEVLLVCINGKWGNLDVEGAVRLARAVRPRVAIPNHYDMMAPNLENPARFVRAMAAADPGIPTRVLDMMQPYVWRGDDEQRC
jgi:L-ascorbate 6-phosphate lactonase